MKVLPLVLSPDDRLHQPCQPVSNIDQGLRDFAIRMLTTMYASNGVGLAAPQVGRNIRLIVVDCSPGRNQPIVLFNPVILKAEGEVESDEGCLSFPGLACKVKRAAIVQVSAQGLNGYGGIFEAKGLWAICIQHEIDHLDGVTFNQRGQPLL